MTTAWLGEVVRMIRAWIWLLIVQIHLDIGSKCSQSQGAAYPVRQVQAGQPAYQTISPNTVMQYAIPCDS